MLFVVNSDEKDVATVHTDASVTLIYSVEADNYLTVKQDNISC